MMHNNGMLDYGSVMRSTVITTTEILEQIEQDLLESRLLIRARNTDDDIAAQLVASLQEDNALLMARVETLEADLAYMHEYSAQSNETLFKEFEEKILACNGEIERVISQCNGAISDRDEFETQLRQMEVMCAAYSAELESAKLRLSESTAHDDRLARENAQLKEELLRMAHNQYSLQEQLALATAAASTSHTTTANHAELASLRGPQGDDSRRDGSKSTNNLYDDEDIAALLQRVKQLEEQNRALSKPPENHLPSPSAYKKPDSSVYREPVSVLPASPAQVQVSLSPPSQNTVHDIPPSRSSALQAPHIGNFSHPSQGYSHPAPHAFSSPVHSAQSLPSTHLLKYSRSPNAQIPPVSVQTLQMHLNDSNYTSAENYGAPNSHAVEQYSQQESLHDDRQYVPQQHQQPMQPYHHQQHQPPQQQQQYQQVQQVQQVQHVQQHLPPQQQYQKHVHLQQYHQVQPQYPLSTSPNNYQHQADSTATSTTSHANAYLVSSPQHYEQPVNQYAISPASSPTHHVAPQQHSTNHTHTSNAQDIVQSPHSTYGVNINMSVVHSPTAARLSHTNISTASAAHNSYVHTNNSTNTPIPATNPPYPTNTTTTRGMFDRQLASPESDGGNPFELDESYVQNHSFNFNLGYQNNAVSDANHAIPTRYTANEVNQGEIPIAAGSNQMATQQNRVRFGSPQYHFQEENSVDYTSQNPTTLPNTIAQNNDTIVACDEIIPSEDRSRDLSAEYNDLYNAELHDIIAYSESQLSASQQNIRQRSPQRFYEDSHLTGRRTHSASAYSGNQSMISVDSLSLRYANPAVENSYVSESDESSQPTNNGQRETLIENSSGAVGHTNDGDNINTENITMNTITNSTNETDTDYPDDFESYTYDDDISGYLDDHRADRNNVAESDKPSGANAALYSNTDNNRDQETDYNDADYNNNQYGTHYNHVNDGDTHSNRSEDDAEFDNVFMYDGSSASALAPVEYDPSMHDDYFNGTIGLDELSRLSL